MRSASLCSSRPRSAPLIFGQGPSSNALRAALTARSMSALSPSATWQMVSPVAGLRVANVLPLCESTHLPPMSIGWSLTFGGLTVRGLEAVAVLMKRLLSGEGDSDGDAGWIVARRSESCQGGSQDSRRGRSLASRFFRGEKTGGLPVAMIMSGPSARSPRGCPGMSTNDLSDHAGPPAAWRFASTRWSLVAAAGKPGSPEAREALAVLCRTYWYPLYAYARRRLASADDAQDLTQEFFARLLEKDYLQAADPRRGKFRSFLLSAFQHFLSKEHDRASAQKRGGGRRPLPLDFQDGERRYVHEPADLTTPETLYERRWALSLLEQALTRLRQEFAVAGKEQLFEALKGTLTGDGASETYSRIGRDLGLSEPAVKTAVHRLRRRYQELLRAEIAQTVASSEEVEDELRDLFAAVRREKTSPDK